MIEVFWKFIVILYKNIYNLLAVMLIDIVITIKQYTIIPIYRYNGISKEYNQAKQNHKVGEKAYGTELSLQNDIYKN